MNPQQLERPRFRTDLVSQPLEEAGQRFIDVTDPDSGKTFRFYEVEYSVACAMDGERDVAGLIEWSKEELGLEPKVDEVQTVISTLADLGYLSDSSVELGAAGGHPPQAHPIVTSAAQSPVSSGAELGLGRPGVSPHTIPRAAPAGGDVALGPSGRPGDEASFEGLLDERASEMPAPPPAVDPVPSLRPAVTSRRDDDDGPTQVPPAMPGLTDEEEVSVDLSDHLSIGADDVKEAVRQSRVIAAVSPEDLEAELAAEPAKPAPKPEPARPEPIKVEPPRVAAKAEPAKVVQLPEKKPAAAKEKAAAAVEAPAKAAEPAQRSGGGLRVLLVLLLLVAVGVGAYWYYTNYVKTDDSNQIRPSTRPTTSSVAPPARPADRPEAKLEQGQPTSTEIAAKVDGVVAWVPEAGAAVDQGDVVVKLKGFEKPEKDLNEAQSREEYYQRKLEKAQESANEADIATYTKKIEQKREAQAIAEEQLEAFVVRSPHGGTVEPMVELNAEVTAGAGILKVSSEAGTQATFAVGAAKYEVGAPCKIALKTAQHKAITDCRIVDVTNGKVTVAIPSGAGVSAGEIVVLL